MHYNDLEHRELNATCNEDTRIIEVTPVRKKYNLPGRGRGYVTLLIQGGVFSLLLLTMFAFRFIDTSFTRAVLDGVSQVAAVDRGDSADYDNRIRFVGGIFSEKKCILKAPFSAFSFDVSGENLKLVGLSTALKPCASGIVTETGTLGELNYVDVKHTGNVVTRYLTASAIAISAGAAVTRETIIAVKDTYSPVILNVYVSGRLIKNITVNANMEIECVL